MLKECKLWIECYPLKAMKVQFEVDPDNIVAFADILEEEELRNEIVGSTEENLLLIDVYYSKDKQEALESLEDLAESDD